ncbi:hypothetical protein H4R18_005754, partial [Coemansia javaensis]
MDARAGGSAALPAALRSLLSKGSKHQQIQPPQIQQIQHQQIGGVVPALSRPPSPCCAQAHLAGGDPAAAAAARTSLDATVVAAAAAAAGAAGAAGAQRPSGGSGSGSSSTIGAWLSRYSLRPGSGRASANSTASTSTTASSSGNTIAPAPADLARHSIDSTLAAMQLSSQAFAAVITGVELREHAVRPSASSAGLRMLGASAARKRHVVYRILVSGRDGQWWAIRRYSEFHDLCAALRRRFPRHAARWADLFPSRRFGQAPSVEVAAQWTDRLNAFLRSVTADTDVCPSEDVQRFLRENAPPPGTLSPAPDADADADAEPDAGSFAARDPMGRV